MKSVSVWYLRTSWRSIRNRTSERSERVRFLIQSNVCVNTIQTHFPWCIMFIICILRFECLFNSGAPQLRKFRKPMNAKNFGLVRTSLPSVRPSPAHTYIRTQSHNANVPVFIWREVAWRDAFTTEMLKNTKCKVSLYVFAEYVLQMWKEEKEREKENKKRRRLSKVQRERERRIAS